MAKFIWTERHVTDGETHLSERTPLSGTPPEGWGRYECKIRAPIGKNMETGQILMRDGRFEFDAATVEEAFMRAPVLIKQHMAELSKRGQSDVRKAILEQNAALARAGLVVAPKHA